MRPFAHFSAIILRRLHLIGTATALLFFNQGLHFFLIFFVHAFHLIFKNPCNFVVYYYTTLPFPLTK